MGHTSYVFSVAFNPSGNILASGGFDEHVKLWDIRSGTCISTLPAHSDPVTGVSFSRDSTVVASGSHDGLIRLWDVSSSECLKTIYASGNPAVSGLKFSPNSRYLLSGNGDNSLRLWDIGGDDEDNEKLLKNQLKSSNSKNGSSNNNCNSNKNGNGSNNTNSNNSNSSNKNNNENVKGERSKRASLLEDEILTRATTKLNNILFHSIRFAPSSLGAAKGEGGQGGGCVKTYRGHYGSKFCPFATFSVGSRNDVSVVTGSEKGGIFIYDVNKKVCKARLDWVDDLVGQSVFINAKKSVQVYQQQQQQQQQQSMQEQEQEQEQEQQEQEQEKKLVSGDGEEMTSFERGSIFCSTSTTYAGPTLAVASLPNYVPNSPYQIIVAGGSGIGQGDKSTRVWIKKN